MTLRLPSAWLLLVLGCNCDPNVVIGQPDGGRAPMGGGATGGGTSSDGGVGGSGNGMCDAPEPSCESPRAVRECVLGRWRLFSCRGPEGCSVRSSRIHCDARGAIPGDPCPFWVSQVCSVDARFTLECIDGIFRATTACRTCTEDAGQVACLP